MTKCLPVEVWRKLFLEKNPFRGSWGTNILWKIYGGSFTPGANDQIMQGAREKVEKYIFQ